MLSNNGASECQNTFVIHALGCRTNQYEIAVYRSQLEQLGYRLAEENEHADICIINTCSVTQNADKTSLQAIKNLISLHPKAHIGITGCFALEAKKTLSDAHPSLLFVDNQQKEELVSLLLPDHPVPPFSLHAVPEQTRAFVKIQDGCNSFCSYCIIPRTRGRSRSRSLDDIVQEIKQLVSQGCQEVVLTGIHIGDFDGQQKSSFKADSALLHLLEKIQPLGLQRIRLSSIDPHEVSDSLIDLVTSDPVICPSLHLVLQSGSDAILAKMRRKYTVQHYLDVVKKCTEKNGKFTFTTDVIVGFPGETEADFQQTIRILETVPFAKVHFFPFSARPKTAAAHLANPISAEIIQERKQRANAIVKEVSHRVRQQYLGKMMSVLLENKIIQKNRRRLIGGHTRNFLYVNTPLLPDIEPGQLHSISITENSANGLSGKICR